MTTETNDQTAFAHRRPNVGRSTGPAATLTQWLATLSVTPNKISAFGLIFGILAGLMLALSSFSNLLWAEAILIGLGGGFAQLRLICNLLDGTVAQYTGNYSPIGAMWNEIPDRASDWALFTGLGIAAGAPWLGLVVASLALLTAYLREYGRATNGHSDFSGLFSKPGRVHMACLFAVASLTVPLAAPALSAQLVLIFGLVIIGLGTLITIALRISNLAKNH